MYIVTWLEVFELACSDAVLLPARCLSKKILYVNAPLPSRWKCKIQ